MNKTLKFVLPILVLVASAMLAGYISDNPSQAKKQEQAAEARLHVTVAPLLKQSFTPVIKAYGEVKASKSGTLVAEVSGKLEYVSPKLATGEAFNEGEMLARIDARQYQAALVIAEGNLAAANFKLEEEIALGQQAKTDWVRLGKEGEASALALRKPHLVAAKAQVKSAEASLFQAQLNLEKTQINAPYSGFAIKKFVDQGQVVSSNTGLAEIVGAQSYEVRLPVSLSHFALLDLKTVSKESPVIELHAQIAGANNIWPARLAHIDPALDSQSKQVTLVVRVEQQSKSISTGMLLKLGQFVEAHIQASPLKEVFVIPVGAIYQNNSVYIAEAERLQRKDVNVIWRDQHVAVISDSLEPQTLLVTTPLGQPISGTLLAFDTASIEQKEKGSR